MTEQPLISVVIPAYNAGATLERTLDSLRQQSWKALEIIVVDDGSKDDTLEIARRIAAEEPRMTILTQKNAGVSAARNLGLTRCRGKYIRFMDSDDTMPPDSMERLVTRAEQDGAELVIGGYTEYIGTLERRKNLANREDVLTLEQLFPLLCRQANSYFYGVLWNKLFRRELVEANRLRFQTEYTWGEDFAFVMDYLAGVQRIAYLKELVYDYRRSPNGLSVVQVWDSVIHPLRNSRMKWSLYQHLKRLYVKRGAWPDYRNRLWVYLFRVGLN